MPETGWTGLELQPLDLSLALSLHGVLDKIFRDAWLAQLVEHVTFDLRAVSSSATLGILNSSLK